MDTSVAGMCVKVTYSYIVVWEIKYPQVTSIWMK